jgi:hypothetical protein
MINDARCRRGSKQRIATAKATFNKKQALSASELGLNIRKKLTKCYILGIDLHGAETWTLWKVDRKCLERFEMRCWRRMEKISWTDHVRNEEVLRGVKEERNIIHTVKRRKADWIGHILRNNCLLKHIIEEETEVLEDKVKDVRSYRMILRKRQNTEN